MHWAIWDAMFKAQNAFEGVISNFPNRIIASVMRRVGFRSAGPTWCPPTSWVTTSPAADRAFRHARSPHGRHLSLAVLRQSARADRACAVATIAAEPIEAKLRAAVKEGRIDGKLLPGEGADALAARGVDAGAITAAEAAMLAMARELTATVIRVDDFAPDLGASESRPVPGAAQVTVATSVKRKAAA
jgi:acyl-CoA dehydrogenase